MKQKDRNEAAARQSASPGITQAAIAQIEDFIRDPRFPCVGAKSALARGRFETMVCGSIADDAHEPALAGRLIAFSQLPLDRNGGFRTLVALFPDSPPLDDAGFEAALWLRVAGLEAEDVRRGFAPDPQVDSDPASARFAVSLGGRAYFLVGLHPGAERPARRFAMPAIAFNLHHQFDALRADGRYDAMRATILARDLALAGTANPMIAKFGEASEARQYSGRAVGEDWVCPYAGRAGLRRAGPEGMPV